MSSSPAAGPATAGQFALGRTPAGATRVRGIPVSAQELYLLRDDLGDVTLDAFLVIVGMRLQLALDVDLTALGEVFPTDFPELVPGHDTVPLGALLLLARGLVLPVSEVATLNLATAAPLGT